jgi:hypothetical protein
MILGNGQLAQGISWLLRFVRSKELYTSFAYQLGQSLESSADPIF